MEVTDRRDRWKNWATVPATPWMPLPAAGITIVVWNYVGLAVTNWGNLDRGDADQMAIHRIVFSIVVLALTCRAGLWHRPRHDNLPPSLRRTAPLVASTCLGYLLLSVIGWWVVNMLVDVGPIGEGGDATDGTAWLIAVKIIVATPLFEEVLYRGAILSIVLAVTPRWAAPVAIVVQAVLFGLQHGGFDKGYNAAQVAGIVTAGLLLGWITLKTRSLIPAAAAHISNNLIAHSDNEWAAGAVIVPIVLIIYYGVYAAARDRVEAKESQLETMAG